MARWRPCAKLSNEGAGWRLPGGLMKNRRVALACCRGHDVDQSMINSGQGKAQVAGFTGLVAQRLGFVDRPKELGEHQRGGETSRAKTGAQGRCAHSVRPPCPKPLRTYGIPYQPTTAPREHGARPQPYSALARQPSKEVVRPFKSWKY